MITYLDNEEFFSTLCGVVINQAVSCDGGMHFYLGDGRVLVLVGQFQVGVYRQEATH